MCQFLSLIFMYIFKEPTKTTLFYIYSNMCHPSHRALCLSLTIGNVTETEETTMDTSCFLEYVVSFL